MAAASVIIPARNAADTLGRTLDCLARQEGVTPYEVIVVDDGSTDGSAEIAESAGATVIRQQGVGPAEARNRGVAESSGEVLAFCDADCFPTPGWLAAGLSAVEGADLVQGRVLPDPGVPVGPFDRSLWVTSEAGLYESANLFVRREPFDRVGGFVDWLDVELGKAMAEDIWLGWRLRRSGCRTSFAEEALVHHAVFERGPRGLIAERRRLRYFPAIARRVPELREDFFHRRWFLNERSAAFDAMALGALAAVLLRTPLPLAAGLPYLNVSRKRAAQYGRRAAPLVAAVDFAADAVSLAELLNGSARYRSLVL